VVIGVHTPEFSFEDDMLIWDTKMTEAPLRSGGQRHAARRSCGRTASVSTANLARHGMTAALANSWWRTPRRTHTPGTVNRLAHEYGRGSTSITRGHSVHWSWCANAGRRCCVRVHDGPAARQDDRPEPVGRTFCDWPLPRPTPWRVCISVATFIKDIKPPTFSSIRRPVTPASPASALASRLPRERQMPSCQKLIGRTLSHMAPEQTGGMIAP